jgi:acetoin utilization protein AcuB
MSSNIKTIHPLDTIEKALEIMKINNIKKLPAVLKEDIVGIITVTDISKAKPDLSNRFIESWVKPRWND